MLADSIRDGIKARRRKQLPQASAWARAEVFGLWEARNHRRAEAEAKGQAVRELPPSLNGERPE